MTTVSPYKKEIMHMLYETLVALWLTFGYALAEKNVLGFTRPSTKLDMDDVLKMTGTLLQVGQLARWL